MASQANEVFLRRDRDLTFDLGDAWLKRKKGKDIPVHSVGDWARGFQQRLLLLRLKPRFATATLLLLGGLFQAAVLNFSSTLEQKWVWKPHFVAISATVPAERPDSDSFSRILKDRAIDNQIVLTVTTYLFLDMTLNLICSLEKIGLTNYIIGALDDAVYVTLKENGYAVYPAYRHSLLGGDELKSAVKRREDFHKVNLVKEEAVVWALRDGYEVVLTDADIVWVHNPMRDLRQNYREFDFLFQAANNKDLEQHELNGGFLYVKPTKESQAAMALLISTLTEDFTKNDQTEFRNVLCLDSKRTSNTTCWDPQSGASTLMLPRNKYRKARMLADAEKRDRERLLRKPDLFTIHFNGDGPEKKSNRMKKLGQWYLDKKQNCTISLQ